MTAVDPITLLGSIAVALFVVAIVLSVAVAAGWPSTANRPPPVIQVIGGERPIRDALARALAEEMHRQNPMLEIIDELDEIGVADDYDNKFYDTRALASVALGERK